MTESFGLKYFPNRNGSSSAASMRSEHRRGVSHFLGHYRKARQVRRAKGGCDGYVRGVTASRNQHSSNARGVIAGIENPPLIVEIRLKPGAEIHRKHQRNADVAEVSGGVACRNVQGAAEGDGQMLIIAAHANTVGENVERRARRTRMVVAEPHFGVHPVAVGLHPSPAWRD